MNHKGKVWIVGAGPGDVNLLTIKAETLIKTCDVVVYDALVSPEVIGMIPKDAKQIYVGKRGGNHSATQEEINRILYEEACKGQQVLRLKGGDPFVFGRGGEELELLQEGEIPYEIVPGITSAIAVPAYAGVPVTHRDFVSSVHIITGHPRKGGISRIDYPSLVNAKGTLIFLMGVSQVETIREGLIEAGMSKDMPAAAIMRGTTAGQKAVFSTLEHLPERMKEDGIKSPAIIVVGEVTGLGERFSWVEKRPLHGKTFVVTRPKERASGLSKKLRELGAQVLELSTINIEPIIDNRALFDLWEYRDGERWLLFTSPSGVQVFFEEMERLQLDLRSVLLSAASVKIGAIGSATAKELKRHGLFADVIPDAFCAKALGEAVAERAMPDSEIVILRAKIGSEELIPPLKSKGLCVKDVPLYVTTHAIHPGMQKVVAEQFEKNEIQGVLFTSKSTVTGFVEAMPGLDYTNIKAICIGEQTAGEAKNHGMQIEISKEAKISSMIELLLQEYGGIYCD